MEGHNRVQTFEAWMRSLMGFGPSPFLVIHFYYHGEEFIIGNRRDSNSALRWDKVVLNCPGSKTFDPQFPWVYKLDNLYKSVVRAIVTFADCGRASWQVGQQAAKCLQYLGI